MRQTELHLSADDRITVEAIRAKGTRSAREVNRAHILLALDRKIPETQVMAVLGVGRMMIWRTRAAYWMVGSIWRCATCSARADPASTTPKPKLGWRHWRAHRLRRAVRAGRCGCCTMWPEPSLDCTPSAARPFAGY